MGGWYKKGKEAICDGTVDYLTADIRAVFYDATYVPNLTTDDNLDDIASIDRVKVSGAFASKTVTNGVFDAADLALTSVSGNQIVGIAIYAHTGVESTSRLLINITTGTNLPYTPTGGDIDVVWSDGATKIAEI